MVRAPSAKGFRNILSATNIEKERTQTPERTSSAMHSARVI